MNVNQSKTTALVQLSLSSGEFNHRFPSAATPEGIIMMVPLRPGTTDIGGGGDLEGVKCLRPRPDLQLACQYTSLGVYSGATFE